MTFFRRLSVSAASLALLLAAPALAQVQSTPLPELSPEVIAADVTTVFIDGEAFRSAPSFDPFETIEGLGGRANLREARGAVDRLSGEPIFGAGAILDISTLYAASRDEFDLRGYDDAVFLSGERVRSIRYNPITRECSSQVTDVVYRDDYYAGVSHGLVLGLYSAYPRYRGHRNYDFYLDDYRRPFWRRPLGYGAGYGRGFGHRGYGGYRRGYGHGGYSDRGYRRDGRYHDRRSDRRRDRHHDRRSDRRDDRRDGARGGRRGNDATRTPDYSDRNMRVGTGIGPLNSRRMTNGRRNDAIAGRDTRRNETRRNETRRNETRRTETRPVNTRRSEPRRARSERNEPAIPRITAPRPVARTPALPQRMQRREAPRARPRMENAAPARQETRRAEPRRSEPKRSAPKRTAPKRSERVNRDTDRAFSRGADRRNASRGGKRGLDYYPVGTTRVVTTESSRCAKEEQLALFIPMERLDAARFDGLTVLLLDRNGAEIPVFIPPNYIEGFQRGLVQRGTTIVQ